jgi:hypothetical protein
MFSYQVMFGGGTKGAGGNVYLTITWLGWETPCPTYANKLERDFFQFLKF